MQFPRHLPPRAGFTLIECLVVIAIIAILAGLLLPALPRGPQWLNDMTFGYSPSDQDLVGNRVAPPEPNQSPLPAIPGTFYELNWSVENAPSSNGLSEPIDIDGMGTTRTELIPGNPFGTVGGTLTAERVGDDLSLTSTADGFLTLDLVDLPFPYLDDVFPPPAFGSEYNQLVNMTPLEMNNSILIPSTELAGIPTLEVLLQDISPKLIRQTGEPVAFMETNFGEAAMELQEFSEVAAVPEPATWAILAVTVGSYAGWAGLSRLRRLPSPQKQRGRGMFHKK